jgi:hypothetical protein
LVLKHFQKKYKIIIGLKHKKLQLKKIRLTGSFRKFIPLMDDLLKMDFCVFILKKAEFSNLLKELNFLKSKHLIADLESAENSDRFRVENVLRIKSVLFSDSLLNMLKIFLKNYTQKLYFVC